MEDLTAIAAEAAREGLDEGEEITRRKKVAEGWRGLGVSPYGGKFLKDTEAQEVTDRFE